MSNAKPSLASPSSEQVLRLGTRASALALTQSGMIAKALEKAHQAMGLRVELIEISTRGDRDQRSSLVAFGGTGIFTKELEAALLAKEVDFAVHSLKDLPTLQPDGLVVAAISKREDVRDMVVTPTGVKLKDLPAGAIIGTGSPRRQGQLRARHPHLDFQPIRGNIDTRIKKAKTGRYAAAILARAGLKRLGLPEKDGEVLPLSVLLPAPGQAALGLECRATDRRVRRLLKALHDPLTAACVAAERACLAALGGGCHLPLGAYGKYSSSSGLLKLKAILAMPDGSLLSKATVEGEPRHAKSLGRNAAKLIRGSTNGSAILRALEE